MIITEKEAFKLIHDFLVSDHAEKAEKQYDFCMAGFILGNTLSDNGAVTRGICVVDENEHLIGVNETGDIVKTATGAACDDKDGNQTACDPASHVSMNMWGLTLIFWMCWKMVSRSFSRKKYRAILRKPSI